MTAAATGAHAADPENTLKMELSSGGTVTIDLMNDLAPGHAERLKELTRAGFYNGIVFHRVIDGFMAQTGDPTGTGMSGSDKPDLKAEFSQYQYKRGTVGMARKGDPDSANSQFFICFTDTGCASLTGQYTVVGQVSEGMENIDKLAKGEPPAMPDKIVKLEVAADAAKTAEAPAAAAPAAEQPAPEAAPAPAAAEPATQSEPAAGEPAPASEHPAH